MRDRGIKILVIMVWLLWFSMQSASSQPYFDVGGITAWYIPGKTGSERLQEFSTTAFVALPVSIGKRNKLIFYPIYETRRLEYAKTESAISLSSLSILFVWRHASKDSSWIFTTTLLPRSNASDLSINTTTLQPGAAFIGTYRVNPALKVKAGLYYNLEYFGGYFMPLAGIEWKINEKLNLFGVLPNAMKFEYRLSKIVYTGLTLKTITNSYRYKNEDGYFKVKDNHLCLFADFYLPGKITLMAEVGHTVLREIKNRSNIPLEQAKENSMIFKAGIYYRMRLD